MGLNVESKQVRERLKCHKIEQNTEELQHMQEKQQKTLADEDEVRKSVLSSLNKEMCAKWGGKCSYL